VAWKSLRSKSDLDYKLVFLLSIVLAIFASISYFSGPATAEWVKSHTADYQQNLVENHALLARIGFIFSILNGLLGIMAIANYLQGEKPHKAIPWVLFCLIIISLIVYTYTAHLGGLIRRPDLMLP